MSLAGKDNAWIKPNGQFIEVGYQQHSDWAWDYCYKKFGRLNALEEIEKVTGWDACAVNYLHKLGWVRLMTWRENVHDVLSDETNPKLTAKQKETLAQWRIDNGMKDITGFNVQDTY